MKKFIKMLLIAIPSTIGFIAVVAVLFIKFSPEFGGSHSNEDKERYATSGHYENNEFQNLIETSMDMDAKGMAKTMWEFLAGGERRKPASPLPMIFRDSEEIIGYDGPARLMWYGHSAFLLQMEGKNILLDPMFGQVAAPHPWLGANRFNSEMPISIENLPSIDAIIISHDHYDHLDYGSIKALIGKTKHFYLPLGVGAHFREWGVPEEQITEFNWWDAGSIGDISIAFTPSRHFSGRGVTDRNSTLWGSWVIKSSKSKLFFSGDSGYGPHFKQIGEKFGPFDFALMECGQYNEKWAAIHMMPEETALATEEVDAKVMMPIHWGAFTLALHQWDDPIKRVVPAGAELSIPVVIPQIGEFVSVNEPSTAYQGWWEELQ
ncbi:MBL fold metallo-hydrolase [Cryomorphaceae bacterium 1068]|nr:MBL fold metallo-hydrolase [Cryomorphaceae bacterium 1068]